MGLFSISPRMDGEKCKDFNSVLNQGTDEDSVERPSGCLGANATLFIIISAAPCVHANTATLVWRRQKCKHLRLLPTRYETGFLTDVTSLAGGELQGSACPRSPVSGFPMRIQPRSHASVARS